MVTEAALSYTNLFSQVCSPHHFPTVQNSSKQRTTDQTFLPISVTKP